MHKVRSSPKKIGCLILIGVWLITFAAVMAFLLFIDCGVVFTCIFGVVAACLCFKFADSIRRNVQYWISWYREDKWYR